MAVAGIPGRIANLIAAGMPGKPVNIIAAGIFGKLVKIAATGMPGKPVNIIAAGLLAAMLVTTACSKDEGCSVHPDPFRFNIIDAGTRADLLATGVYNAGDMGIYYFLDDERQDLIVSQEPNPPGDYIELFSAQLPMISLTGRSDTFFLTLNANETDTLFVVVEKRERGDCDYHPYITVKHNGKDLPVAEGEAFVLEK